LRVGGQVAIATLAAYGFARWEFRGREILFAMVLGAMMIPHQLTMLPIYLMIAALGWFDTWHGLIVPNLAIPYGIFLLRQHLKAFPQALIDAAAIDGAGHWRALWPASRWRAYPPYWCFSCCNAGSSTASLDQGYATDRPEATSPLSQPGKMMLDGAAYLQKREGGCFSQEAGGSLART